MGQNILIGSDTLTDVSTVRFESADTPGTYITFSEAPTGNQDISTLDEYDVTTKATAIISTVEQAKIIPENIRSGVTILGVAGNLIRPSYLISDGDLVSTFYFNTNYAINTFLANPNLTYDDYDEDSGLYGCYLGFGGLEAVDLTQGEHGLVWVEENGYTIIYASTAMPDYGVTTAGWQVASCTPDSPITVDYIHPLFLEVMDNVITKSPISFGI